MIDIHSHLLNEIDDGARTLEESKKLLKDLSKIGITHVILTPHYINGSNFVSNNYQKQEKLEKLKEYLKEENISLYLYLGNEIFIDKDIISLFKKNELTTLNGSRYFLIEFPVSRETNDLMDILFYLRNKNYIPIIAHPERYSYFQKDTKKIDELLKMGCLFQGNLSNVLGKYGKKAKKLFLYMLKNNKYQFLASDIHHEDDILFKKMTKVKKEIIKLTNLKTYELLTIDNPLKVLKDEKIVGAISDDE